MIYLIFCKQAKDKSNLKKKKNYLLFFVKEQDNEKGQICEKPEGLHNLLICYGEIKKLHSSRPNPLPSASAGDQTHLHLDPFWSPRQKDLSDPIFNR